MYRTLVVVSVTCAVAFSLSAVPHRLAAKDKDGTSSPASATLKRFPFVADEKAATADAPKCDWQLHETKGKADYELLPKRRKGELVLRMRSKGASYLLGTQVDLLDPSKFRWFTWSWNAAKLPTKGDVRVYALVFGENRNDQAAQVLVVFEGKKMLCYVWDTTAPVDTEVDEPSLVGTLKTKVVDSGDKNVNKWVTHSIDIYDDYQKRFGAKPGPIQGVIVQCNSNHTKSESSADYSNIFLSEDKPD